MTQSLHRRFPCITETFAIKRPLLDSIESETTNALIRNVRAFYLVVPRAGLTKTWPELHKDHRHEIISQHLTSVCEPGSSGSRHIELVDRWLVVRQLPRTDTSQYGRTLEKKYGRLCFICGQRIESSSTVDHIFPLSWGGTDTEENLMLAHKDCNSSKNSWLPGDSLSWAPDPPESLVANVSLRLRYLVFLRDDFRCTHIGCQNGLFTKHALAIATRYDTGICCFDNLMTACEQHAQSYLPPTID